MEQDHLAELLGIRTDCDLKLDDRFEVSYSVDQFEDVLPRSPIAFHAAEQNEVERAADTVGI